MYISNIYYDFLDFLLLILNKFIYSKLVTVNTCEFSEEPQTSLAPAPKNSFE
jgi:hypothetical protein